MAAQLPTAKPRSNRTAYLVLGMHRSGTSALTQLLALAGAQLPSHVMPGDEHNAKGYFEPWRIAIFNDERLRAASSAWDDPFTDPTREPADEPEWRARAVKLFRSEYLRAKSPLLKDPRVSVLLPLWRGVLQSENVTVQCVIPVRHPLAVAGSLAKRDGFPTVKSLLLWMNYMVETEAGTRDLPRAFVEYDALLADWRPVVNAMEERLGTPLPNLDAAAQVAIDDFLTADLRHNTAAETLASFGQIGQVAQGVLDWLLASARGACPDTAPMAAAHDLIRRMRQEVGLLVSPITRSNNQATADLIETRGALDFAKSQVAELLARSEKYSQMNEQLGTLIESLTSQVKDLEKMALEQSKLRVEVARVAEEASLQAQSDMRLAQDEIEALSKEFTAANEERRNAALQAQSDMRFARGEIEALTTELIAANAERRNAALQAQSERQIAQGEIDVLTKQLTFANEEREKAALQAESERQIAQGEIDVLTKQLIAANEERQYIESAIDDLLAFK